MNLFWKNISRYPKFLITSVSGLVVIILSPLTKFSKKSKRNKLILIFFLVVIIFFLIFLLNLMLDL